MLWHRLALLAITGASSYSHEGPLRPPKLVGKDKAVVAVVEIRWRPVGITRSLARTSRTLRARGGTKRSFVRWSASVRLGSHCRSPRRRDAWPKARCRCEARQASRQCPR